MKDRKIWLEEAILDYILTHRNVESVDIVSHFGLQAHITLTSLRHLVLNNKVYRRELYGNKHEYLKK